MSAVRPSIKGAIDSGASTHCLPYSYQGGAHHDVHSSNSVGVVCANNSIIKSSATDLLDLKQLTMKSRISNKFHEIQMPLISVKRLCDSDLEVHFKAKQVTVTDQLGTTTVLAGALDPKTELYMIHLHDQPSPVNSVALPGGDTSSTQQNKQSRCAYTIKTVPALINFYHISLGAPPISTWIKAINLGWFTSWPALTADRVREHCSKKPETAMGHQHTIRQGINPTTTSKPTRPTTTRSATHPISAHIVNDINNLVAMDLPGRYPVTSRTGNKYMFLLLDHNTNYINVVPIPSRKSSELVKAFETCYKELTEAGFKDKLLRLDNEVSKDLIAAIQDQELDYQIVSPGNHRTNPAERAIRDFKAHFISTRACWDKNYPANAGEKVIPHVLHTLNMLRPSNINPMVSAHTMLKGHHDFNSHPIAPAGCKVVIHDR